MSKTTEKMRNVSFVRTIEYTHQKLKELAQCGKDKMTGDKWTGLVAVVGDK